MTRRQQGDIISFLLFFQNKGCELKINLIAHRKHRFSTTKTTQITLLREIIAVCFEKRTKPINTISGQNAETVNVKHTINVVTAVV
jgi:hypothetical protein